MSSDFKQRLAFISQQSLVGIGRGVEREALRVTGDGSLSQAPHPYAFGSALCHDSITTDFAESLLEFITPVARSVDQLFDYLNDIHHYVAKNLPENETLWPMSMPCYVQSETVVELAQYGSSNIGRMKTTYREGLKNRYGSMMQVIAGVHYNFSLPEKFWQEWATLNNSELNAQDAQSAGYLGLIRNYFRYGWVIPYLFGASPALCGSFLQGKESHFDFKKVGKGTLYLPYATSLRLSDLGYTSSAQSALNICYNSLENYTGSVRHALAQKSAQFAALGVKENDQYVQLNDNILQIENELYASIRPKRVQKSGETPSQALNARGIEYIEIRSLDVNPFATVGITQEQVNFLDLFLTWCAIAPSSAISMSEYKHFSDNLAQVVTQGRCPDLTLEIDGSTQNIATWGAWLTEQLKALAVKLDSNSTRYQDAIDHIAPRFSQPELTSSARILSHLLDNHVDNGPMALALSKDYKTELQAYRYQTWSEDYFVQQQQESVTQQAAIEAADDVSFDQFLTQYFQAANK